MSVTILALLFLLLMLTVTVLGFRTIMKQGKSPQNAREERCSLCRTLHEKSNLIERQVGDTRLFFFCRGCIEQLHNDSMLRNPSAP